VQKIWAGFFGLMALLALGDAPALAEKADDTLRIAVGDWWSTLDPYQFPSDEAGPFSRGVYETLLRYDERHHQIVPRLAKAWRQVDDKTVEFVLRDDVKFHNGDHFDADDVVGTLRYLVDPNTQLRFKDVYAWIDKVEKVDQYTVRITAKESFATELTGFAYRFYIYDWKVLSKLENKADYGRMGAIATGPYKVVSLNQQKMVLTRNEDYYDRTRPAVAPIKNIVVVPIPDGQTQVAQFMTGNIDLIRNPGADLARELAQDDPNSRVTPMHNGILSYITLDAAGRSDNKVMMDQRVRKAFMEAIDRQELAKTVIPGGEIAEILDGICVPADVGCVSSTKPPAYNPEDAKKQLAAAGYKDGLDLEFDVHEPLAPIGEAIVGMLRKVGIRATMRPLPIALYGRMRGEGKLTAFLGSYPTSAQPDMNNILDLFFDGNRDYWDDDPVIREAQKRGAVERDFEKRNDIYKRAIDQVNDKNYILPMVDLPMVFVHTKDVVVKEDPLTPINNDVDDFYWAP
jgi:peptide/nickel transport system substrate-binding protein